MELPCTHVVPHIMHIFLFHLYFHDSLPRNPVSINIILIRNEKIRRKLQRPTQIKRNNLQVELEQEWHQLNYCDQSYR